jgi:hypothetical protein
MSDDLDDLIVDGASDLIDFAFDQVTDSELLKDLPFIGFAVKIAKAGLSVRDRLFLRKVQLFLAALPKIEDEKKARFQEQLDSDKEFRNRVGETLLLIIERLDSLKKPEMLAKAFAYFMKGKIKEQEFRRLASAIDLAFIDDLEFLASRVRLYNNDRLWPLVRAGLAQVSPLAKEDSMSVIAREELNVRISLEISKLGKLFASAMIDV